MSVLGMVVKIFCDGCMKMRMENLQTSTIFQSDLPQKPHQYINSASLDHFPTNRGEK